MGKDFPRFCSRLFSNLSPYYSRVISHIHIKKSFTGFPQFSEFNPKSPVRLVRCCMVLSSPTSPPPLWSSPLSCHAGLSAVTSRGFSWCLYLSSKNRSILILYVSAYVSLTPDSKSLKVYFLPLNPGHIFSQPCFYLSFITIWHTYLLVYNICLLY